MGTGFAERLWDAMRAAGVFTLEDLSRRAGIPLWVMQDWIAESGETMTLRHCIALRKVLHVRGEWLLDGAGSMGSLQSNSRIADVASKIEQMRPENRRIFFALISKMLQ